MSRLAVIMGWAMTGGQDGAAAFPGRAPAAAGPLARRGVRRRLAGTHCPQRWVSGDGRRIGRDELLGTSFTILPTADPTPSQTALAQGLGIRTLSVADLVVDGILAALRHTTQSPVPSEQTASKSLLRSTTR